MKSGISPNLKIGENTEVQIIKQEVLEDIFEEKYESDDREFIKLVNMYTSYKGDEPLKEVILQIYDFMQSMPFPEEWLKEKIELFNIKEESFEKTSWGEILLKKAKDELKDGFLRLEGELERIKYEEDTGKFVITLSEDIRKIQEIYESETWDDMYLKINNLKLDRFPVDKKVPEEIKEKIKDTRGKVKEEIKNISKNLLIYTSKEAIQNAKEMYDILSKIGNLILEFAERFTKVKQDRNMMDFNDIEHFALKILIKEENEVCKKYKEKYEEILIDEYQDSNLVQEKILTSISRRNNIFMVGDVKQSIYKFRGGRPELFLEKYKNYKEKEELKEDEDLKIKLFKNFRSRQNVLSFTNIIFDSIMSKELGDIDYNEGEYLNLGAYYNEGENLKAELHIIDLKDEEESIYKEEETEEEIVEERIEDVIIEAKFTAKKIKELIDTGFLVSNKDKTLRKITYKDIVVLLRSSKNLAPIYEQEISKLNIPVFSDVLTRISRNN